MNAVTAFLNRQDELRAQLGAAKDISEAVALCTMALEQTACELAQGEQDEHARQRQQAVMALARRAPQLLRAATARGELVLEQAAPKKAKLPAIRLAGAFLLGALAVYEMIEGRALFAGLQLAGGLLALLPVGKEAEASYCARGVAQADADALVRALQEMVQAADVCVSDLTLLDKEAGVTRLSGTADEAMLDLLTMLMEAKASGRSELAMRSLSGAEQYLHMLGIELIAYDAAHAQLFDLLPTMGEARTIRPAMMQDGKLLRRGTAAVAMHGMRNPMMNQERGVGA